MGVPVQRQESVPPLYTPPQDTPPQADDDDAAWHDEEVVAPAPSRFRRLLRMTGFVMAMLTTGAVMAVAWEFTGLREASGGLAWPALASAPAQDTGKPQREDQLARLAQELEALRKSVGELSTGMQQLATSNAALQAGQ